MENRCTCKSSLNLIPILLLFISHVLLVQALAPAGTIERTTKQQILASLPPSHESTPTGSSHLFLTSPSGKYAVFLLRRETSIGAGGFGSDFCYVQVQAAGVSVWESECTAVSNVNTCSLVFSDAGLEIFDGSRSAWDTDVEDDDAHIETLTLVDHGDMQIRDKEGELKWKASDSPVINQNCGSIGAPGLSPAHPPFASPIHSGKGPFGQDISNQRQLPGPLSVPRQQQQGQLSPLSAPQLEQQGQGELSTLGAPQRAEQDQGELSPLNAPQQPKQEQEQGALSPLNAPEQENPQLENQGQQGISQQNLNQPFSSVNNRPYGADNIHQPLVDNTPFDSGSSKIEIGLVCLVGLFSYLGFFL